MAHSHDHGAHEHEHDHDHDHDHGHDEHDHPGHHHHVPTDFGRAFAIGVTLNTAYVVAQVVFGLLANSVALLADAAHNLGDVLSLLLAWGASVLVKRQPSGRFTYGLRKTSVLAALANAVLLVFVTGAIASEAVHRFLHPSAVGGWTVVWVAALGILVNGGTAMLFFRGRNSDLNVRGAFMHMAADAVVSLGVVFAGIGILLTSWTWLDPAVSLAISIVILWGTWDLLRDSVKMSLDAVPEGIHLHEVRNYLDGLEGVTEIHDLHIWPMSTTETALTVHLLMPRGHPGDAYITSICEELRSRFRINHTTVQIEIDPRVPCALAPDHVV
jgi:cobalt-zinc-cadmium efflux system protein